MNCIFCGQHLRDGAVFCSACGKKQPNSAQGDTPSSSCQPTPVISPDGNRVASFCYSCKASLPAGATVCPQCGAKINRTKKEIKKPRRKLKKVIGGIIVALICLILAGTLLLTAAGIGIAALLMNRPAEPVSFGTDIISSYNAMAIYGGGRCISFNDGYSGSVTPDERYVVYVDNSRRAELCLYDIESHTKEVIFFSFDIHILKVNNSGVFFYDSKGVYAYNFKSEISSYVCDINTPFRLSGFSCRDEMAIAYVEENNIYTYEINNEAIMMGATSVGQDTVIHAVSADGSAVVFGNPDSLWYTDFLDSFMLYGSNGQDGFDNENIYSSIFQTKDDYRFVISTSLGELFIINDGYFEAHLQVPCTTLISHRGIYAVYDEKFDADKPFYSVYRDSQTGFYTVTKIYAEEERTVTLFADASDMSFCGDNSILYTINGEAYLYSKDETSSLGMTDVKEIFASPYGKEIAYMTVIRDDGGVDLYRYTQKEGALKIANNVSNVRVSYCGKYVYYVSNANNTLYVHDGKEATKILTVSSVDQISMSSYLSGSFIDPERIWIFTNGNQSICFYNGKELKDIKLFDYVS